MKNVSALGLFTLVTASFCATTSGYAAEPDLYSEESFYSDMPVVLTVTRLPQAVSEVPAAVTVIDRQMIEASGAVDIPDLMRLVPGFQVGHFSGTRTSVTYHGMSDEYARRLQVLVDGRSVYLPATGGVDWFDLPLAIEDVERIEVTRGPNGTSYGANSFLGVISIITRHPENVQGTMVHTVAGEEGYRRGAARYGGRAGALDYRLTLQYETDNGHPDVYLPNKRREFVHKDDRTTRAANFRSDYRAGVNDYVTLQAGITSGVRGDGLAGDLTQPFHENDVWRHFEQVKWKHVFSSEEELNLQLYHVYSDTDSTYRTAALSDVFGQPPSVVEAVLGEPDQRILIDQSVLAERYDVELEHQFRAAAGLRMAWGLESRLDRVLAPGYLDREQAIETRLHRGFANGEWEPHPDWLVNVGAMVEDNELTGTRVSPRAALNYRLNRLHTVRAAYTRAFRTPVVLEEYADYGPEFASGAVIDQIWKSEGDLKPEKITAMELGLVGHSANGVLQYDVRVFRELLRDLIATPIDDDYPEPLNNALFCPPDDKSSGFCRATVFNNDSRADLEGLELQLELRPSRASLVHFGFSRVRAAGDTVRYLNPPEYESIETLTPQDTLSLLVDHTWDSQWRLSTGFFRVSNMRFLGGDETGGYTTADVRLARAFRTAAVNGEFGVTFRNVLGRYYDYLASEVQARESFASLKLEF